MSKELKVVGDLEIDEDLTFEKWQWAVERIGWLLMLCIVMAALLGAFGRGPLSQSSTVSPDNALSIEYDHFGRLNAQTDLRFQIAEGAITDSSLLLWLDREYLKKFEIKEISPKPERMDLSDDRVTLVYRVPKAAAPLQVHLILEPVEMGAAKGAAGLEGTKPLSFRQFIYP
jgi:hypothetical protein